MQTDNKGPLKLSAREPITEDDADHGIHRYYEECPLMLNRENEQLRLTDRRHRLILTLNVT